MEGGKLNIVGGRGQSKGKRKDGGWKTGILPKETVIDLKPYLNERLSIRFVGGREVQGILKGADAVCNLVLDQAVQIAPGIIIYIYIYVCRYKEGTRILLCKGD